MRASWRRLIGGFVIAGITAGRAIIKPVLAEAYINLGLAQAAVLFAFASALAHVALHTEEFAGRGHIETLAKRLGRRKFRW